MSASNESRVRAAAYLLAWPTRVASPHDAEQALETLATLIDQACIEERIKERRLCDYQIERLQHAIAADRELAVSEARADERARCEKEHGEKALRALDRSLS